MCTLYCRGYIKVCAKDIGCKSTWGLDGNLPDIGRKSSRDCTEIFQRLDGNLAGLFCWHLFHDQLQECFLLTIISWPAPWDFFVDYNFMTSSERFFVDYNIMTSSERFCVDYNFMTSSERFFVDYNFMTSSERRCG